MKFNHYLNYPPLVSHQYRDTNKRPEYEIQIDMNNSAQYIAPNLGNNLIWHNLCNVIRPLPSFFY